ncbi:hypothetical protein O59_001831 [Cellvibrio sp. BR]|nr:hypothetical protein O59_001831 [Cellvibrio sp. BR]
MRHSIGLAHGYHTFYSAFLPEWSYRFLNDTWRLGVFLVFGAACL